MNLSYRHLAPQVSAAEINGLTTCKQNYNHFIRGKEYQAVSGSVLDWKWNNDKLIEVSQRIIKVFLDFNTYQTFTPEEFIKYFETTSEKSIQDLPSMDKFKKTVEDVFTHYGLNNYDFQIEDVALLLHKNIGLLASGQGCGKTLQSLVWMRLKKLLDKSIKNCLIVVQQDLILQWQEEAKRVGIKLDRIDRKNGIYRDGNYITYYEYIKTCIENYRDKFQLVILDEAHKIKSGNSLRGKAIRSIEAKYKLCLTGTPVKNMIKDLFFMLGWLCGFGTELFPYAEKDYVNFYKEFGGYEFTKTDKKFTPILSNTEKLQRLLAPVIVRRTLETTGIGIVKKNIYRMQVNFTPEQQRAYEKVMNSGIETTTKYWALRNILTIFPENNKLKALTKLIEIFKNEQVIIYSTIVDAMNYYHKIFPQSQIANGEIEPEQRAKVIYDFKKGLFQILIGGIESIGTGHSLQNCRNVIVTDYGYTASGLDQAVARVRRINSTKDVNIFKLYVKGSIEEEQQLALIDTKRETSEKLLDYDTDYNFIDVKFAQ